MKRSFASLLPSLFAVVLGGLALGAPAAARATDLLSANVQAGYSFDLPNISSLAAVKFQTDSFSRNLGKVTLPLANLDSITRHVAVGVATDNAGAPNPVFFSAGSIAVPANTGMATYTLNFAALAAPLVLAPNTTYWIVIHPTESAVASGGAVSLLKGFAGYGAFYESTLYQGLGVSANLSGAWSAQTLVVLGITLTTPDPVVAAFLDLGGPVPGISGSVFSALNAPAINANGAFVYRASISAPHAPVATMIGRSRQTLGANTVTNDTVARSATAAAGLPGATYKAFGDPIINENGELAFTGSISGDSTVTNANDDAVWTDLGGTLQPAWRNGTAAPGAAPGQNFASIAWINLAEGVLYIAAKTADLTVTPAVRSSGIWKWDGANLTPVVVLGQTLEAYVANGAVAAISTPMANGAGNATSRLVSSDGTLCVVLKFADKSSAIVEF